MEKEFLIDFLNKRKQHCVEKYKDATNSKTDCSLVSSYYLGAIEQIDMIIEYVNKQSDDMIIMEFSGWNWSACMEFIYGPGLYPQEYCCKEEFTILDKNILKKIYRGDKIIKKNGSCYVITTHYNKEPYIKRGHFLNVWKVEETL